MKVTTINTYEVYASKVVFCLWYFYCIYDILKSQIKLSLAKKQAVLQPTQITEE